jgi:hypothetical protein
MDAFDLYVPEPEEVPLPSIVGGLDIHRKQLTFDYLDMGTGEVKCGQIAPADREHLRRWLGQFENADGVAFAAEACTGWRSPGHLSRQGPPVLRWCTYEAGKAHARAAAPDHAYYASVKDRIDGKRAALAEARKIVRRACHILTELGDDAFTAV